MKPLIRSMLPDNFLLQYAVYLQTCAHIELVCWEIVRLADGSLEADPAKADKYLRIRKSTVILKRTFRECASNCTPEISSRIIGVSDRIDNGTENRNAAAHGAWFTDGDDQTLKVEHYFRRPDDPALHWRHISEPIDQPTIDHAISDADDILREVMAIRENISSR